MSGSDERRKYTRAEMLLPAELRLADGSQEKDPTMARILDISPSGIRLKLDADPGFEMGDRLFVRLEETSSDGFINLQGVVRWVREEEPADWEMGLKLTGMALSEWDPWLDLLSWQSDPELPSP